MSARQEKAADGSLLAGLRLAAAVSRPGQRWSHRDLAYVCGVSRTWIYLIERQALRKIRFAMKQQFNLTDGQMFGFREEKML